MANRERDVAKERRWRELVKRHAAGGLSVREFCRREKLAESAFYAWRRTIGERDGHPKLPVRSRPVKRIAFVPAVVTSEPQRDGGFVLELAGGRVLRLPESISVERLAEIVQALEARAAS